MKPEKNKTSQKQIIETIISNIKTFGSCPLKIFDADLDKKILEDSFVRHFQTFGPSVLLVVRNGEEDEAIEIYKYFLNRAPFIQFKDNRESIIKMLRHGVVLTSETNDEFTKSIQNNRSLN